MGSVIYKSGEFQKSFNNRKELFLWLKKNKQFEIDRKKATLKFTNPGNSFNLKANECKSVVKEEVDPGAVEVKAVVNSCLWLDSHGDVHIPGLFVNSIKQKGAGRIYPINEHKFSLDHVMGETLSIEETEIPWADLGVDKKGTTSGVIAVFTVLKSECPGRYKDYISGRIKEHSVSMLYIDLRLAINDEDPEFEEEKKEFDKWIDKIGNDEDAKTEGFFFTVYEAKLIEYSCVLAGSNEKTPTLSVTEVGADKSELMAGIKSIEEKLSSILKK